MRMKLTYVGVLAVFFSCAETPGATNETTGSAQQLIGEWNNLYIKVNINSNNNSDSNEVFEVNRTEWEEKLKIKPVRTFFREDSSWNSAHYNLKDSLVYNPSGKWWVENNKLVMVKQFPSADTTTYSFLLGKDTVSFESIIDWDMDGKKDDKYFGKQVKLQR